MFCMLLGMMKVILSMLSSIYKTEAFCLLFTTFETTNVIVSNIGLESKKNVCVFSTDYRTLLCLYDSKKKNSICQLVFAVR
jgi:hypothetical protein